MNNFRVRRLLPKTLKSRAILILCGLFVLSHAISLLLYEANRDQTIVLTEATDLAERIIGIVNLAHSLPAEDRQNILEAAETQFLATFPELIPLDQVACQETDFSAQLLEHMKSAFQQLPAYQFDVCVRSLQTSPLFIRATPRNGFDVLVSIEFPNQDRTTFHAVLPDDSSLFRDSVLIYLLIATALALVIAWYLILKVVTPIERLAVAAEKIGVDIDAEPLDEQGTREVAIAARAFNKMQARLQRLIHGQTQMLAAISHDLRSAVTRLELRGELLKDETERAGLLRVTHDMRQMVQSVLDFIRGHDTSEETRNINLTALVESLCEDLKDEGFALDYQIDEPPRVLSCRPAALRRAIQNLIDNAVQYGGKANLSFFAQEADLVIAIEDDGPGIPADQLQEVFKPFYRLEPSRNPKTGGVGLGLAIAQNIVHAHGGEVLLMNREGGGLRAEIHLPTPAER